MISYLIPHFNRPYLLDIHIKLTRKYAPKETRIVISDDGSRPEVQKFIKSLAIDDVYFQPNHYDSYKHGSYSSTLLSAIKLCQGEYLAFMEDDFFFCPNPITFNDYETKGLVPENDTQKNENEHLDVGFSIFEEATQLLKNDTSIRNIQLSKDRMTLPVLGEIKTANMIWDRIDREKRGLVYYCNCPSILRLEDFLKMTSTISPDIAVSTLEGRLGKAARAVFGESNWAVSARERRYAHIGSPFSNKLKAFKNAQYRMKTAITVQQKFFNRVDFQDIEAFNEFILNAWLSGVFFIDFDELISNGIGFALSEAFHRLSKSLDHVNKP